MFHAGKPPQIDPRHQLVAEAWLRHGNGAKAARDAGFGGKNPGSAVVTAARILKRKEVQAYISWRRHQLASDHGLEPSEVVGHLKIVATSDITHYRVTEDGELVLTEGAPKDAMKAVASFKRRTREFVTDDGVERTHEVEFRLWPKVDALRACAEIVELLGRASMPATMRAAVAAYAAQGGDGAEQKLHVEVAVVAE